jgi:diguanylate cyclase (GGDEF)-like protein/PAS domain S-box-containing protein
MSAIGLASLASGRERTPAADRILVVAPELRLRVSLQRLLESQSRQVAECGTAGEALALLERRDIALVLLDLDLPDPAREVLAWLGAHRSTTRAIVISSDDRIETAIQALRHGVVDFVRKPGEMTHIRGIVDGAVQRCHLERRHATLQARVEQSERLHRFMVEHSPDLIYTLDDEGRFLFVNDRFESLLGFSRDEVLGRHYSTVVAEGDRELVRYVFNERRCDQRAAANVEVRLKIRHGHAASHYENRCVVAMLSAVGVYDGVDGAGRKPPGAFLGTYGVARDITERKVAEETVSFQAFHDHLTQLPNRRLFKDRLELAITQARRSGGMVGVMFIDLDHFKRVNDSYGHDQGDELLKHVAQALRRCVRAGDTVARQGGDEFTVLLPDLTEPDDAAVIAGKIVEELDVPLLGAGGQALHASASIGMAVFPRDGTSADALLKHADVAMYKVKTSGRNAYRFFSTEMDEAHHERLNLERDLRRAVQRSELELHFQPRYSVGRNRIVGMEALVRWHHPHLGMLLPDSFINIAEEIGLIRAVTDSVLAQACAQLARWHAAGHAGLRMAVNVSAQEFDRADLVERIAGQVEQHRLPADALEIEIAENVLSRDVPTVIDRMRQLRERGVRIAIDDFGTGYSSLNYLRRLPINAIKLDHSFVRDLDERHRNSPILKAIIGIADGLDLGLSAEGVETDVQRSLLQNLGCDEMQGYLFSQPVPAAQAELLLAAA